MPSKREELFFKNKLGEMAEWLKAPAWKACILLKVSRVRIPFSPPKILDIYNNNFNIILINEEN